VDDKEPIRPTITPSNRSRRYNVTILEINTPSCTQPPSLVVLEQHVDTELNLKSKRRKFNMDFRVGRG